MIANNKIISLTVIGLVIGIVLFLLMNSGAAIAMVPAGGVAGFLAGWIWQSRTEHSET